MSSVSRLSSLSLAFASAAVAAAARSPSSCRRLSAHALAAGGGVPAAGHFRHAVSVHASRTSKPIMIAMREKRHRRQARHNRHDAQHHRQNRQRLGIKQKLPAQLAAQVVLRRGARHQNARRHRRDERRHLRNQAVADGQHREMLQRFAHRHALLHDADGEAADDVDERDENGRNGVAAHEFARAVHRAVKIRFLLHAAAAVARLGFVDQAGVEFRVNRHLLAGHGVQA